MRVTSDDDTVTSDHAAALAAIEPDVGLCTVVRIEGSFSRRIGAQLAVSRDGRIVGSLADGCLERQLASDLRGLAEPSLIRYGRGSPIIDFRLPCGGGLDILLDPFPDRGACRAVAERLASRRPAALALPANPYLQARNFTPRMMLNIVGSGPEFDALAALAKASGLQTRLISKDQLSLGSSPTYAVPDRWTATVLLFHDHEWEAAILAHALSGNGFYIGAQGGRNAREARASRLREAGLPDTAIDRIRAPVGLLPSCREPEVLAVSILAELYAEYEKLRDL